MEPIQVARQLPQQRCVLLRIPNEYIDKSLSPQPDRSTYYISRDDALRLISELARTLGDEPLG